MAALGPCKTRVWQGLVGQGPGRVCSAGVPGLHPAPSAPHSLHQLSLPPSLPPCPPSSLSPSLNLSFTLSLSSVSLSFFPYSSSLPPSLPPPEHGLSADWEGRRRRLRSVCHCLSQDGGCSQWLGKGEAGGEGPAEGGAGSLHEHCRNGFVTRRAFARAASARTSRVRGPCRNTYVARACARSGLHDAMALASFQSSCSGLARREPCC